jgi:hypothetical protein
VRQIYTRVTKLETILPPCKPRDRVPELHALAFQQFSDDDLNLLVEAAELREQGKRKQWEEKHETVWARLEAAMSEAAAELKVPEREWRG